MNSTTKHFIWMAYVLGIITGLVIAILITTAL